MNLEEVLGQLGLDEKEVALYLASLEIGESLVKPLAEHANLKRATLYEILPRLHKLGLISYGRKGKRRTIKAEDPDKLVYIQEEKLKDIKRVLPQLVSHYNILGAKPKVFCYEGQEGIKQVYEDTLVEEFPIMSFLQIKDIYPDIRRWLDRSYEPRRVRKGMRAKMLVSGKRDEVIKLLPENKMFREMRYTDEKLFPANIEVQVYGNKVAFTTYKEKSDPMGLIVESSEIAETMRSLFKMAWEGAQRYALPKMDHPTSLKLRGAGEKNEPRTTPIHARIKSSSSRKFIKLRGRA